MIGAMNDALAMVLAGGRVDAMGVLTARRSMAAVPFGGFYRVIDFVLTNLSVSQIEPVGILSQYRPYSLMDHVGIGRPWDYNGRSRELMFLPPFEATGERDWYRGTADAVYQNLHVLERYKRRDVVVLSGDHVYRMDYRPVLDFHRRTGADVTMVFRRMDVGRPARFGVGVLDGDGRVTDYAEKPAQPQSDLASMTIYVFRAEVLAEAVRRNAVTGRTFHLYDEVIPELVRNGRVVGYVFEGGWEYLRPLSAWHDAHMRLIGGGIGVPMDRVLTNLEGVGIGDAPPAFIAASAEVRNAWLGPGCRVRGRVVNSVLFPGVTVEAGAVVEDAVLLNDCVVGRGARVVRSVLDKACVLGEASRLAGAEALVSLGKGVQVARGAILSAGAEIGPGGVVGDVPAFDGEVVP